MTAKILNGKELAQQLRAELAEQVAEFIQQGGPTPTLAAVLVGSDPASAVYVRNKRKACEKAGMGSHMHDLPASTTTDELLALVSRLNEVPSVHGILIQLPLPDQIDELRVLDAVNPLKDVDAFHPENVGRLVQGRPRFAPCTPSGILELLRRNGIDSSGKRAVRLGRSEIVGKPMALLLMQRGEGCDATVTVCHSRTQNLPEITRQAELLIVAVGRPKFVTADMVRPGAAVIDVGIHRTDDGLQGDIDFEGVREVAGWITPVPGGVGPLTIAMVLRNTLAAARLLTQP
ncbi:MAG: bifunctional methylenetetrahydrofolate dehydrogenase/methenyltetrahydrofolate cyclohydrolase FolD [Planctomycetales bacterium]